MNALTVVPTYNERDNLPLVARGVLTHEGFRMLVVDDGSPDGTGEVADRLAPVEVVAARDHAAVPVDRHAAPRADARRFASARCAVAVVAQAVWGMARSLTPDRERATIALAAVLILTFAASSIGQRNLFVGGPLRTRISSDARCWGVADAGKNHFKATDFPPKFERYTSPCPPPPRNFSTTHATPDDVPFTLCPGLSSWFMPRVPIFWLGIVYHAAELARHLI